MIGTCSRTLLDTIDHLLDYSRVNSLADTDNKFTTGNVLKRQNKFPRGAVVAKKSSISDYRLDDLIEGVVECLCRL